VTADPAFPLGTRAPGPGERSTPEPRARPLSALTRMVRPRQWIKNLLVLAAPAAAGVLGHPHAALLAAGAFAVFCLAASGTYFLNDALDAEADRRHPAKRSRPVAAGTVSPTVAMWSGTIMMALSVGAGWWLAGYRLALIMGLYVAMSSAYSWRLKHEPVLDLVALSSGFILRAIAGGVATAVPLSNWFLIVTSFGALFLAVGKRSTEHLDLGDERATHRPVLAAYPATFLRSVRLMSAAVTITAYCLWAFERAAARGGHRHPIWFELSIVPVVVALLHLELRYEAGRGSAPEEMALGDGWLQVLGVLWVALFAIGVYG
jgi:decaprenyl-phosphate phosphoribosyltransferase